MTTTKKTATTKTKKADEGKFSKEVNGFVTPNGTVKKLCGCCGKWLSIGTTNKDGKVVTVGSFYRSSSRLYKYNGGLLYVCKDCVTEEYNRNFEKLGNVLASIKATCITFNIPLDDKTFQVAMKNFREDGTPINTNNRVQNPFKEYMRILNSLASTGSLGESNYADDFDTVEMVKTVEKVELDESKMSPKEILDKQIKEAVLSEDEITAKNDCINMLDYDPFIGSSIFDQKYLYKELVPYLDEDTMEDTYKLSQVIQIVNNNNQVRKINLMVNALSSDMKNMMTNQADIKSLTTTKKQIVDNTNDIAKENAISVKNRGNAKAGKSTLGRLMKDLRELRFENAEADYYDQNICLGMQKASDASWKAIFAQIGFDENDKLSILRMNKELTDKLQREVDDLKEENRLLNIENMKLQGKWEETYV